jgi:hypothetical protein
MQSGGQLTDTAQRYISAIRGQYLGEPLVEQPQFVPLAYVK